MISRSSLRQPTVARRPTPVPAGSAAGAAYVNLRGFGPTRSLTLVNGRRFAIFGPEQVTDLNTIPTALIEAHRSRHRRFLRGVRLRRHHRCRQLHHERRLRRRGGRRPVRLRQLHQLADLQRRSHGGRQLSRKVAATRSSRSTTTSAKASRATSAATGLSCPIGEACVTGESWSDSLIGTANGSNAANCATSGGRMGFVFSGSGDIPNGRFTLTPAQLANAGVQTAAHAARASQASVAMVSHSMTPGATASVW